MVLFVAVEMAQFACLFLVYRGQDRISQNADWGLEEGRFGEKGTEGIQSMVPCKLIEIESYLPSQLPWIMFVVCLDGPCFLCVFLRARGLPCDHVGHGIAPLLFLPFSCIQNK